MKVYVASSAKEGGVYEYDYDGEKLRISKVTRIANPMFLALCGDKMHAVFGVDGNNYADGSYGVFALGRDGLEPLGKTISTKGCVPCHLSVDDGPGVRRKLYFGQRSPPSGRKNRRTRGQRR